MKLHLGCGEHLLPGFVNLDKLTGWLFQDGLPGYMTGSVDGITISHALYMVPEREWPEVLAELHRVLKPGGVLRVTEDDNESPTSPHYHGYSSPPGTPRELRLGVWWNSVTQTGPAMMRRHLEAVGFTVYDMEIGDTHFEDGSLLIALRHEQPPHYFFMEGVK